MIGVGDERIQVVHHYKMDDEWIEEIEAPVNQKIEWVTRQNTGFDDSPTGVTWRGKTIPKGKTEGRPTLAEIIEKKRIEDEKR